MSERDGRGGRKKRSNSRESTKSPEDEAGRTVLSVGEAVRQVFPEALRLAGAPAWPPDAFAIAAKLLQLGDAYRSTVNSWPPARRREWGNHVREVAVRWRSSLNRSNPSVPVAVREAWQVVRENAALPVERISRSEGLSHALLLILAVSDEVCADVGFLSNPSEGFVWDCKLLLDRTPSTLCRRVSPTRAIVLPKVHTPQSGITIRSLSHNLALLRPGEVVPRWQWLRLAEPVPGARQTLKVLLIPTPELVTPMSFEEVTESRLGGMHRDFGFFRALTAGTSAKFVERCLSIIRAAVRETGPVDIVVFPESSLGPEIARELSAKSGTSIVAGVAGEVAGRFVNRVEIAVPDPSGNTVVFHQAKHHRWRMDGAQVAQYGLSARLDPTRDWWEDFEIEPREVHFWCPLDWLTVSVLICEDLARPDPAAEVVRSVGPNLLISLLLDGPQLAQRWSGRYATVFADDPGSSVLTLTSIGMAQLCRPEGKPASRVIGLWKDSRAGVREIMLPEGHEALVLVLRREQTHEWTADGRKDNGSADRVLWAGVHAVRVRR